MSDKIVLLLAGPPGEGGNQLSDIHVSRLKHGAAWAAEHGYEVCVAATFSPKYPKQAKPLSTMSACWLNVHYPDLVVHDVIDDERFNTRGEMRKFIRFAQESGATQLAIASAWWHVRGRVKILFCQEFSEAAAQKILFVELPEAFSAGQRVKETIKRVHMQLPRSVRHCIEQAVRATGFDPS